MAFVSDSYVPGPAYLYLIYHFSLCVEHKEEYKGAEFTIILCCQNRQVHIDWECVCVSIYNVYVCNLHHIQIVIVFVNSILSLARSQVF